MHFPHPSLGKHFFALLLLLSSVTPAVRKEGGRKTIYYFRWHQRTFIATTNSKIFNCFPTYRGRTYIIFFWRHIFCLKVWGKELGVHFFFGDNPPPDFITWKIPIPTHHTPVSHIKQRFGKGNDGDIFFSSFFSGKTEEGAKKKLREGNKTNGSWFTPARYTGNQKMHSDPSIVTIQKSMCPPF